MGYSAMIIGQQHRKLEMEHLCHYCDQKFHNKTYMFSVNLCNKCSLTECLCSYCTVVSPLKDWIEYACPACGELESDATAIDISDAVSLNSTRKMVKNIKLTTAFTFTNHEIEDEVGIVTAECVFGMNVFRDFFAGMTDFFGGRSDASQKILRDARNTCLAELKSEAAEIGADGVMGIDLDYSEISGKGKGMLFLVASGTAVKFKGESV